MFRSSETKLLGKKKKVTSKYRLFPEGYYVNLTHHRNVSSGAVSTVPLWWAHMHPHTLILDVEDIYPQLFYNFAYVHQNYYRELAQHAPTKCLSYSLHCRTKTLHIIFNVGCKEQYSQIKLLEELN